MAGLAMQSLMYWGQAGAWAVAAGALAQAHAAAAQPPHVGRSHTRRPHRRAALRASPTPPPALPPAAHRPPLPHVPCRPPCLPPPADRPACPSHLQQKFVVMCSMRRLNASAVAGSANPRYVRAAPPTPSKLSRQTRYRAYGASSGSSCSSLRPGGTSSSGAPPAPPAGRSLTQSEQPSSAEGWIVSTESCRAGAARAARGSGAGHPRRPGLGCVRMHGKRAATGPELTRRARGAGGSLGGGSSGAGTHLDLCRGAPAVQEAGLTQRERCAVLPRRVVIVAGLEQVVLGAAGAGRGAEAAGGRWGPATAWQAPPHPPASGRRLDSAQPGHGRRNGATRQAAEPGAPHCTTPPLRCHNRQRLWET